jgi:hypothetical protein
MYFYRDHSLPNKRKKEEKMISEIVYVAITSVLASIELASAIIITYCILKE